MNNIWDWSTCVCCHVKESVLGRVGTDPWERERVCFGKGSSWGGSIAAELLRRVFCSCCCITLYMSTMTATVRALAEILRQEDSEQADSMRKCTEGQRVLLSLGHTQLETQWGDDAGKERNILPQINSQPLKSVQAARKALCTATDWKNSRTVNCFHFFYCQFCTVDNLLLWMTTRSADTVCLRLVSKENKFRILVARVIWNCYFCAFLISWNN